MAHLRKRSSRTCVPTGSELAYLDASAIVKLVLEEPESDALRDALQTWPRRATTRVAIVEVIRAVRSTEPLLEPLARQALAGVDLVADTDPILIEAATLDPSPSRTLDALHLATALRERSAVSAFVSYDLRQLEAAAAHGLPIATPR
jgi:predicted nucleic acid-binding protein